jgi:hypothetical protein
MKAALPAILVLSAALLAGCSDDPRGGYTTAGLFPTDVHTVAVPIPQRAANEFRINNEMRLCEALAKCIERETPYKLVQDRGRADTVLECTLHKITQRVLSFDPTNGQAREIEVRVRVSFTWRDLRDGRIRAQQKNADFIVSSSYIPESPFNEDFFQGSQDAFEKVAVRIMEHMYKPMPARSRPPPRRARHRPRSLQGLREVHGRPHRARGGGGALPR